MSLSVRTNIMMIGAVPLLFMCMSMVAKIMDSQSTVSHLQQIQPQVDMLLEVSDLLHEMQKERGFSAGFVKSKGTHFSDPLAAQRQMTDQALSKVLSALADMAENHAFAKTREHIEQRLQALTDQRKQVSALSLSPDQVVDFYTQVNQSLIQFAETLSRASHDADVTRLTTALVLFQRAKDLAGIERAVLSQVFTIQQFTPSSFTRFTELMALQQGYFDSFQVIGSRAQTAQLDKMLQDPAVLKVQEYRDLALQKANLTLAPSVWFDAMTQKIDQLKQVERDLENAIVSMEKTHLAAAQERLFLSLGLVGAAVLLVLGWILVISKGIATRLSRSVEFASLIASGDLSSSIEAVKEDEIGQLTHSLNAIPHSLSPMLQSIRATSEHLTHVSQAISENAEKLDAGMQIQTQRSNEVASSISELTQTISDVATNTQEAASAAEDSGTQATQGGAVVNESMASIRKIADVFERSSSAVSELGRHSEQIGQIIVVINSIAEQTNLLALNAAIEAARAGEQGRGFAVVADEVRNLAHRTTQATKDVSESVRVIQEETNSVVNTIATGSEQITHGLALSEQAGEKLAQIVGSSKTVTDMVQAVAAASEQQSATGHHILENIESIINITAESSDSAKKLSEVSQTLLSDATDLQMEIAKFKM